MPATWKTLTRRCADWLNYARVVTGARKLDHTTPVLPTRTPLIVRQPTYQVMSYRWPCTNAWVGWRQRTWPTTACWSHPWPADGIWDWDLLMPAACHPENKNSTRHHCNRHIVILFFCAIQILLLTYLLTYQRLRRLQCSRLELSACCTSSFVADCWDVCQAVEIWLVFVPELAQLRTFYFALHECAQYYFMADHT